MAGGRKRAKGRSGGGGGAIIGFNLDGEKELARKLKALGEAATQAQKDAVQAAGEVLVADITSAPGSPGYVPFKTGNLMQNIIVEEPTVKGTRASTRVGPSRAAPYGIYVEYGTERTSRGRFKRRGARPFMRPGADRNRDAIRAVMRETLERAVDAAAKRVRGGA